jgi:hypothetical protein
MPKEPTIINIVVDEREPITEVLNIVIGEAKPNLFNIRAEAVRRMQAYIKNMIPGETITRSKLMAEGGLHHPSDALFVSRWAKANPALKWNQEPEDSDPDPEDGDPDDPFSYGGYKK